MDTDAAAESLVGLITTTAPRDRLDVVGRGRSTRSSAVNLADVPANRSDPLPTSVPVSYTHLDVYKRQGVYSHVTDGMDLGAAQQVAALFEPTVTNL